MNKNEIIRAISEETHITQKDTKTVLNALTDVVAEALKNGERVKIAEFVNFSVKEVQERKGVSGLGSTKGKKWVKPAHKEVKVKPSRSLNARISEQ